MKAKDYIKVMLDDEILMFKRNIRVLKNRVKTVESMRASISNMTEKDVMETVLNDPNLKNKYEELSKLLSEKNNAEIKKMIKDGKIREIARNEENNNVSRPSETDQSSSSPGEQPNNEE
jgi:hypothetical protein